MPPVNLAHVDPWDPKTGLLNVVIETPQGSRNKERAFDFMVWLTGFDQQKRLLMTFNNPPVLSPLFGDREAVAKFPFLPGLLAAAVVLAA